jgi:hypothetical protein
MHDCARGKLLKSNSSTTVRDTGREGERRRGGEGHVVCKAKCFGVVLTRHFSRDGQVCIIQCKQREGGAAGAAGPRAKTAHHAESRVPRSAEAAKKG